MKQHDIRVELERYIGYLERHVILTEVTEAATEKQLREVVKSLRAILAKTERIHY